jgi:dTMP kinase
MLAARAAFVRDVVRPALAVGEVVLADRFALSTLAYQGYARGLDLDDVRRSIDLATGGLEPDLYVVLDVAVAEGAARQRHGGKRPDRIEGEGEDFLRRVRDGYLELAECEAHVRVIDGDGSPETVQGRIRRLLESELPETFGHAGV